MGRYTKISLKAAQVLGLVFISSLNVETHANAEEKKYDFAFEGAFSYIRNNYLVQGSLLLTFYMQEVMRRKEVS